MPESVQMNDISLPHRFIDRVRPRRRRCFKMRGPRIGRTVSVNALTKRVLQILPVIVAVERRRDDGGVPSLRRRQRTQSFNDDGWTARDGMHVGANMEDPHLAAPGYSLDTIALAAVRSPLHQNGLDVSDDEALVNGLVLNVKSRGKWGCPDLSLERRSSP